MNTSIEISVIVPIFNEEKNLKELYTRLTNTLKKISNFYEIIFVNDFSTDSSLSIIKEFTNNDLKVKYISFSRNFGHQIALSAGIENANGNTVVLIDGDLQDPPELISEMYAAFSNGYSVVYAKRKNRIGESFFKKTTAKFFYRILSKITTINIPLDVGDFRLIDRKVVDNLKQMQEVNKFLRGQIAWLGFKQTYVEFDRQERQYGTTGYPLKKMIQFALDGITAFSNFPLRIASLVGMFVSFFAFIIIIYALYSKLVLHEVISGWTSLIISSMFVGGIQLLTIGVIGEYIGRINLDVKKRPLYIVEESNI